MNKLRKTGLAFLGDIPWGSHICQFYKTIKDLTDILVPYFISGLENNEYCIWVTSEPLNKKDAISALRKEYKFVNEKIAAGQIEIVSYDEWYTISNKIDMDSVIAGWNDKLKYALNNGFDGLRLSGNTFFLEKYDWQNFSLYEKKIGSIINKLPILAICSYSLEHCCENEIIDVISSHQTAIIRKESNWVLIENAAQKNYENDLKVQRDKYNESEEKFRTLFQTIKEGLSIGELIFDRNGLPVDLRYLLVNPAFEEHTGLKASEVTKKTAKELFPNIEQWRFERYWKVVLTGEPAHFESDFEPLKKIFDVTAYRIDSGRFATLFTDITERKRNEAEIISLARFPQENPSPVIRVSNEGEIVYGNDASLPLLESRNYKVGDILNDEDKKYFAQIACGGAIRRVEMKIADQSFLITLVPLKDNKYINIYGHDITDRKKAENALRKSEERYALAQKVSNIGSWEWDIATGALTWSDAIEPIFGFNKGGFKKTYEAFIECVHPEDRANVINAVESCLEGNNEYRIEHRIIWPDGSIKWIYETGAVVRDDNNTAVRMLGVVQDITIRKRADEILRVTNEELDCIVASKTKELNSARMELEHAKRLSDIGTLAATVAHELRNPLAVIKTALYNIRRKHKSKNLDRHILSIDEKISESALIINNLLNYSRIKMPIYEKVKIKHLIEDTLDAARKRFDNKNIKIAFETKLKKDFSIEADGFQIKEVLINILNNACQSVEDKRGKVKLSVSTEDEVLVIKVSDNGIGIDKNELGNIFKPFFTTKSKGTGLGLTICDEMITMHKGVISVESAKNIGSVFTVKLPTRNPYQSRVVKEAFVFGLGNTPGFKE